MAMYMHNLPRTPQIDETTPPPPKATPLTSVIGGDHPPVDLNMSPKPHPVDVRLRLSQPLEENVVLVLSGRREGGREQ